MGLFFESGAGDFPAQGGGFSVMQPGLRVMGVIEGSQFPDFGVMASEDDGEDILFGEDECEVLLCVSEDFHIAEESQGEPGESQGKQAPHRPGGQLREQECFAELINQQEARCANEQERIFRATENAAEEASESGSRGFISEDFLVDMSPETDSGDMA